jgi:hypothetical protein
VESARIVGTLARVLRDVGLAEELAQDALTYKIEDQLDDARTGFERAAALTRNARERLLRARRAEEYFSGRRARIDRTVAARSGPGARAPLGSPR